MTRAAPSLRRSKLSTMEASTTGCSRTTRPPGKGPESAADSGAEGGGAAGAAGGGGAAEGGAPAVGVEGAAVGLGAGAAAGGAAAAAGAGAAILRRERGTRSSPRQLANRNAYHAPPPSYWGKEGAKARLPSVNQSGQSDRRPTLRLG